MTKWTLRQIKELPSTFLISLHPRLANLLYSRGLENEEELKKFLSPSYETDSFDPFLFAEMEKVVERVALAVARKETVVIFGDYDADGVTSSAILQKTFEDLGVDCFVYIPDKKVEGYGLNGKAIESFKQRNASLIITVDCGITGIEEVEIARNLGIDVIITDHHHVPENVPKALAIINPHQKGCNYPFKDLAGVGVAFKVVQAIYQRLMSDKLEQTKWMLDLVAIGTIADCVPLLGENRLFVKYGLIVLSKNRRVGLRELFIVGAINIDENTVPDTKKVSFYIAPRINAAGRINHANLAYDLVVEQNVAMARDFALELEASNTQRQKITEEVVKEVKNIAENLYKDKKFIFAVGEHFPIGVVGLVAGKIVQKFNKPTAIFQKGEEFCKGSFRSIPQINIIETIGQCQELLVRFGGHAQAAGVTVRNDKMQAFEEKMNSLIEKQLEGIDMTPEIMVDGELFATDVDFELVEGLEKLKPFGQENEEPIFLLKDLIVREKRALGSGNRHVKFFLSPLDGSPKIFEAISFNGYEKFEHLKLDEQIDILCNVQKDEWNGNKKIQFMLIDARLSGK
jgi:single-stranded-DNA-specific exonuclease